MACVSASVNNHDSILLPDAVQKLMATANRLNISLKRIPLTLDSGFDSQETDTLIRETGMIPIVKPNLRGTKDKRIIKQRMRVFKKIESLYRRRHVVERGFAWEDKYRKLVVRYERLEATFNGFRYLAAMLVNYRTLEKVL